MPNPHLSIASTISLIPKRSPTTNVRCRSLLLQQLSWARHFSHSAATRGMVATTHMPRGAVSLIPKSKSLKARMKDASQSDIPNDMGLLPLTFIRPAYSDLPSLFSSTWKQRLITEWIWVKTRFQNFTTLLYVLRWGKKKDPITGKKKKEHLYMGTRAKIARDLHADFYIALAESNLTKLQDIACAGLLKHSKIQIDHRKAIEAPPRDFQMRYLGLSNTDWIPWPIQLVVPFQAVKIVSDRITPLQFGKDTYIRQIVARITTEQILDKRDGKPPITKSQPEYVVIQQRKMGNEVEPWMIWGTVKPSTPQEIEKIREGDPAGQARDTMMDRIRDMSSANMGI